MEAGLKVFWITVGLGVCGFLLMAGISLLIRVSRKPDLFVGSLFDDPPTGSILTEEPAWYEELKPKKKRGRPRKEVK